MHAGTDVTFLYRKVPGHCSSSLAISCARACGLRADVCDRAEVSEAVRTLTECVCAMLCCAVVGNCIVLVLLQACMLARRDCMRGRSP